MRLALAPLALAPVLACWLLAGQVRFDDYDPNIHTAVIKSGHIVLQHGSITARAPEEPVIAERIPKALLDTPAPVPPGATIRQVLLNTADGTPGEEVLENRSFFDALKPIAGNAPLPNALKFATEEHGTLGWFSQEYHGERVLWSYGPSVLLVRIPRKSLTLVVSGDLTAARLQDGNIARSTVVLAWLGKSERDELIDRALTALYHGNRDASAALVRQALEKFPELESTPDVTLLYLLAQLGLPVKVCVFNNGALGFIELEQKSVGFLATGTELVNPNFAAMAEAIGIRGIRLEDPAEVDAGIAAAFAHDGPVLIDAVVHRTELAMPPSVNVEMAKGFTLYMLKAVMSGRADELIDLAETNLWR